MELRDRGNPPLRSSQTAFVTLNIIKNNNCPQFVATTPDALDLDVRQGVGETLETIEAIDNDRVIWLMYKM